MTTDQILEKLRATETDEERYLATSVRNVTYLLRKCGNEIARNNKDFEKLWYSTKHQTEKHNLEFGYWVSEIGGHILKVMQRLDIQNIVDLGCGCAYMLKAMQSVSKYPINIYGYDNEDILLKVANNFLDSTEPPQFLNKDILTLEKKDIPAKSVIYWWEPIKDEKLCKQFVDNTCAIAKRGQIIIVSSSGYSGRFIEQNEKIERLYHINDRTFPMTQIHYPFSIYRKK